MSRSNSNYGRLWRNTRRDNARPGDVCTAMERVEAELEDATEHGSPDWMDIVEYKREHLELA